MFAHIPALKLDMIPQGPLLKMCCVSSKLETKNEFQIPKHPKTQSLDVKPIYSGCSVDLCVFDSQHLSHSTFLNDLTPKKQIACKLVTHLQLYKPSQLNIT